MILVLVEFKGQKLFWLSVSEPNYMVLTKCHFTKNFDRSNLAKVNFFLPFFFLMSSLTLQAFDTHAAIKRLMETGIKQEQTEAFVDLQKEVSEKSLKEVATKKDIFDLKKDIKILELRMTIKLGFMLTIAVGILATLIKFS